MVKPPRRGKPHVTILDVARRAGVSPSSVSNALTGKRPVSVTTRRRVHGAVDQLGYTPNMLARSLINRKSNTLGVVTFGLEYFGPSRTLAGIEQEANRFGYSLLLRLLHAPDDDVDPALNGLCARRVDGVIWAVPEIGGNRAWITREHLRRLPPMVFLSMKGQADLRIVAVNNRFGAALAVEHLIARRRRKIGLVSGPLEWWEARERKAGWRRALQRAGLESSDRLIQEGDWSAESGEKALRRLLEEQPALDGVFVANDQMALGALRVAHELRRQVPQDLAIAGFDDIPESAFFSPPLTTVSHPLMDLGRAAVVKLQDLLEGAAKQRAALPALTPKLIVRSST